MKRWTFHCPTSLQPSPGPLQPVTIGHLSKKPLTLYSSAPFTPWCTATIWLPAQFLWICSSHIYRWLSCFRGHPPVLSLLDLWNMWQFDDFFLKTLVSLSFLNTILTWFSSYLPSSSFFCLPLACCFGVSSLPGYTLSTLRPCSLGLLPCPGSQCHHLCGGVAPVSSHSALISLLSY